jgi:hypothetical protein
LLDTDTIKYILKEINGKLLYKDPDSGIKYSTKSEIIIKLPLKYKRTQEPLADNPNINQANNVYKFPFN